jgi:hypothetical protein
MTGTAHKSEQAMHSKREIPEDEHLDIDLMLEKYKEGALSGALWYGSDAMNIGWPEELVIKGLNLCRLLEYQRNEFSWEVNDAHAALKQHGVAVEGLSVADGIHLLVGRCAK